MSSEGEDYEEIEISIDDNDPIFQKISEWLSKIEVIRVRKNIYKVRFLTDPIHFSSVESRNQIVGYLCWQMKMYLLELEERNEKQTESKGSYIG